MANRQINKFISGILRISLVGFIGYHLYTVIGCWAIIGFMSIALLVGFIYFLGMCLAAGLDNKFGMADSCMWSRPKPRQLPPPVKLLS